MQLLDGAAAVNGLVAVTCIVLGRAVWARRWTLRPITERLKLLERTMTAGLILRAVGLCLMSPASAATVGRSLHAVFGQWQLDTWIGHCFYIGAAGMTVTSIRARLFVNIEDIRLRFKRVFQWPLTIIAPIMLMLLTKSPNADIYRSDMFDVPTTDIWLDLYWTVLVGFVAFLVMRSFASLIVIRMDGRSRRTANVYLAACSAGIVGCALQIICVWVNFDGGRYFWLVNCVGAVMYAHASASAWRQKARSLLPWVRL